MVPEDGCNASIDVVDGTGVLRINIPPGVGADDDNDDVVEYNIGAGDIPIL